jgi:hypothetical protein
MNNFLYRNTMQLHGPKNPALDHNHIIITASLPPPLPLPPSSTIPCRSQPPPLQPNFALDVCHHPPLSVLLPHRPRPPNKIINQHHRCRCHRQRPPARPPTDHHDRCRGNRSRRSAGACLRSAWPIPRAQADTLRDAASFPWLQWGCQCLQVVPLPLERAPSSLLTNGSS